MLSCNDEHPYRTLINITDALYFRALWVMWIGRIALAEYGSGNLYARLRIQLGVASNNCRRNGEQWYAETGKTFFQGLFFLLITGGTPCMLSKIFSPFC